MTYSIVRVVFEFPPIVGGSVTHIVELTKQINSNLKQQIIIAPDFIGGKELDCNFPIRVIRLPYLKLLSFGDFLIPSPILFFYAHSAVKEIKGLLKKGQTIDIIHVHGSMLGSFIKMYCKIYNLKTPVIIMQHGYGVKNSIGHEISRKITSALMKIFPPSYFLFLDDGNETEIIESKLKKINIQYEMVYHGIDYNYFIPEENCDEKIPFYVLYPHRPDNMKNPDLAIELFSLFLDKISIKNVKLIMLACDGKKNLKELATKLNIENYVEFLPKQKVSNVKKYMNLSSVIIGTSVESNMNRAIQEAMACEKPVIVFNSGGTNKLIKHLENGILIKSGDLNEFADKLKLLYEHPELRKTLGINGRKTIILQRSWDSRIARELYVYEKVISAKKNQIQ